MAYTLKDLIKASGGAGTAGQSFLNDVTGSTAGVSNMKEYKLPQPSLAGSWPLPPAENTYASGHTFTNLKLDYGSNSSHFQHIRRNGTTPWLIYNGPFYTTLNSATWAEGPPLEVTLNLTVLGEYDSATLETLTSFHYWFRDYASPAEPPDNAEYVVKLGFSVSGGGSPSGYDDSTLQLKYTPDIGPFNAQQTYDEHPIRVSKRAYPSWATVYEYEVHDNGSYTNVVSDEFNSDNNTVYTNAFYVRYRIRAEYNGGTPGSWTNYGAVDWSDPRDDT